MRRLTLIATIIGVSSSAMAVELEQTRLRQTKKSTLQGVVVKQTAADTGDVVVLCEFSSSNDDSRAFGRATIQALAPGEADIAEIRAEGVWTNANCVAVKVETLNQAENAALQQAYQGLIRQASAQ